jgi:predicted TIM-barrel fold metal-dependent hydrolase
MDFRRRTAIKGLATIALLPTSLRAATPGEPALLPDLPIIDPHHHFRQYADPSDPRPRYLVPDLLADMGQSGHRFVGSAFIECSTMYRVGGVEALRPLGETAFVRGLAEQSDARAAGIAKAIVARIDLTQGDAVRGLVEQHLLAAGGRLRGIRDALAWADLPHFDTRPDNRTKLDSPVYRAGARALAEAGLSFDVAVFHTQIGQLTDFARALPQLTIVLNHLGCPIGPGPDARRMKEVFPVWKKSLALLAEQPNVVIKLGGLGQFWENPPGANPSSEALSQSWRPWIETGIGAFGVHRCMFASNFPTNAPVGSLGNTYNAYKRIVHGCSAQELQALFRGSAEAAYRIS